MKTRRGRVDSERSERLNLGDAPAILRVPVDGDHVVSGGTKSQFGVVIELVRFSRFCDFGVLEVEGLCVRSSNSHDEEKMKR